MRREPVRVIFCSTGVLPVIGSGGTPELQVTAWTGDTLLDAALDNGVELPHECGGNCTCTTCHVYVEEGSERLSPIEPPEDERLESTPLRTDRSRLACQALVLSEPVRVTVVFDETGAQVPSQRANACG